MTAIPREIDRTNPANALVLKDEAIYCNNTPVSGVGSPPAAPTAMKFTSL